MEQLNFSDDVERYDRREQDALMDIFIEQLWRVTRDGGNKRASGSKPPWFVDPAHETAMFHHLYKWKAGESVDSESGAHPLVHLAWRALAIACVEEGKK